MSQSSFDEFGADRSSVFSAIASCKDDGLRHQARLAFMRIVERLRELELSEQKDTLRDLPTVKIPSVPPVPLSTDAVGVTAEFTDQDGHRVKVEL